MLDCAGKSWTVLGWVVLVHNGPYRAMQDSAGLGCTGLCFAELYWGVLVHAGSCWSVVGCTGLRWSMKDHRGLCRALLG